MAIKPIRVIDVIGKYVSKQAQPPKPRSSTKFIVIHHAAWAYKKGEACKSIFNYHSSQWPSYGRIGYQVVLQEELDSSIAMYIVNPLGIQGANVALRNHEVIGLCAATDFTKIPPSDKWINAIAFATQYLKDLYPLAQIVGHREITMPGHGSSCPGPTFLTHWKRLILERVYAMPKPTEERVIGVSPSVSFSQFWGFLSSRRAPIDELVARRVFEYSAWLDIDPAYIAALWYAEQGSDQHALGATEVGEATANPGNIKAKAGFASATVKKVAWMAFENWQLGLLFLVWYLKQNYGAKGLLSVEAIADVWAKETANTDLTGYKKRIKETLNAIRASTP